MRPLYGDAKDIQERAERAEELARRTHTAENCGCIVYCPLHEAAPELLNALNQAAKLAHKNTKSHSYWLSFRECGQAICKTAHEAIKKAEVQG